MKKTISLILTLVFALSMGSIAFAQNSNSSTTNAASSGTMKHHRKHRKHHRRHRRGGTMKNINSNT